MTRLLPFCAILLLCSCAYVGNPVVPTRDIPVRILDLRVAEVGDHIVAEFTMPAQTTEGNPLKSVRLLEMAVGVTPQPWDEKKWAESIKRFPIPYTSPGPMRFDKASADEWVGKEVTIMVHSTGPKGRTSEWSNPKTLSVETPLATPADLTVQNTPLGFYLSWKSPAKTFRIYRSVGEEAPALADEFSGRTDHQDTNVEFGSTYRYYVQAVNGDYQQSELAVTQPTLRADVFTPSVPTGLVAEPGPRSIELSWDRYTEPRFQGYNVYRSVEGGPFEKVASLIIAPAYSDTKIETGKKYRYSISAVGVNGRESDRSAPVEVTGQ